MAYNIPVSLHPNPAWSSGGNSGLFYALDSSTKKWAASFVAPQTITLSKVAFSASNTGTCPTYEARIETDDGTGKPSGTLAWASANATFTVAASGFIAELSLGATGTLTCGTLYHLVVQYSAGTVNASNCLNASENGQVQWGIGLENFLCGSLRHNGTSWGVGSGSPDVVLVSNDATPIRFGQAITSSSLDFLTNTFWKGVKFVCPNDITLFGCGVHFLTSASAGVVEAKLIDAGNTVLASAPLSSAGWWTQFGARQFWPAFFFPTPQSLVKGTTYRLVWKDSAGNTRIELPQTVSAYKTLTPNGTTFIGTSGTSSNGTASPTTWTDDDLTQPAVGMFSSTGVGGGGFTPRGLLTGGGL